MSLAMPPFLLCEFAPVVLLGQNNQFEGATWLQEKWGK